jgi:AcrR family transcriptional regulator
LFKPLFGLSSGKIVRFVDLGLQESCVCSDLCKRIKKSLKPENSCCFFSFLCTFVAVLTTLKKMMQPVQERIIEQSTRLFIKMGCKSLTMDDIATSMGISKRTIYENFSDKQDLLSQCVEYFIRRAQDNVNIVLKSSDNILDAMLKTMKCRSDFAGQVKYNFFNEIQKYFPDVYKSTVSIHTKQTFENMEKLLEKGQKDKVIRKDINNTIITILLQEVVMLILDHDTFVKYGYEKHTVMQDFMYTFTRGICTEKGLKILDKLKKQE